MSDSHTPPPEKKDRRRATVVAVAVLMAALMLSVAIVGPATQEAEGAVPIVVIGGALAIGAIAGWIANDLMNDGKAANAEAAKSANAATYKASIINEFQTALAFAESYAKDKVENYEADSLLITRRAEWLARELYLEQTAAGQPYVYNPNYVMAAPEMLTYIEAVIESCSVQYAAAFSTMEGAPNNFYGDMDSLQLEAWFISSGYYRIHPSWNNTGIQYDSIPLLCTKSVSRGNFLASSGDDGTKLLLISLNGGDSQCTLHYANGTVAHTYSFTDSARGQMYRVTIPDHLPRYGEYYLDGGTNMAAFGHVMIPPNSNNLPMTGVVIGHMDDICDFWIAVSTGSNSKFYLYSEKQSDPDGVPHYQTYDDFQYPEPFRIAPGTTSVIWSAKENWNMQGIYSTYKTILTTANVAANSYYNLLVETGDDQRYETMPDFLFPDPSQMEGLTVEEMYALLLVYRQQMADYYQNAAYMGLSNASFSPDSIGLYVRGALYNADGTPIYDDQAIWTPFVNVASQHLKVGDNVTFPHSMTVIKWGEAAAIADFLEVNGTTANMRWNYPAAGAYAIIEEIYKDGAPIDEITLSLSNYEVLVPDIPDDVPPGQSGLGNISATVDWLMQNWYWVTVGVGAVTVIAAALLRNSAVAGVGLLIILAGLAGYAATEVLPEWWESVKPWVISQDFWRPGP